MYDKYEPFKTIDYPEFVGWISSRSELWKGGKMIDSGNTNSIINARVVKIDGDEKIEVTFNDPKLNNELANKNIY